MQWHACRFRKSTLGHGWGGSTWLRGVRSNQSNPLATGMLMHYANSDLVGCHDTVYSTTLFVGPSPALVSLPHGRLVWSKGAHCAPTGSHWFRNNCAEGRSLAWTSRTVTHTLAPTNLLTYWAYPERMGVGRGARVGTCPHLENDKNNVKTRKKRKKKEIKSKKNTSKLHGQSMNEWSRLSDSK